MSVERRETFRFNPQPELREAKIVIADREIPAEIVEQSAGGFRVKVGRSARIQLGDTVQLHSLSGHCLALVVHLEQGNTFCQIGLQRLTERVPKPTLWMRLRGLLPRRKPTIHWQNKEQKKRRAIFCAVGAGLCVLIAGICYYLENRPVAVKERTAPGLRPGGRHRLCRRAGPIGQFRQRGGRVQEAHDHVARGLRLARATLVAAGRQNGRAAQSQRAAEGENQPAALRHRQRTARVAIPSRTSHGGRARAKDHRAGGHFQSPRAGNPHARTASDLAA